jgi:hypothetical protein
MFLFFLTEVSGLARNKQIIQIRTTTQITTTKIKHDDSKLIWQRVEIQLFFRFVILSNYVSLYATNSEL